MDLSPQRVSYSKVLPRERIRKSPRWDNDEGVAATVGTIMALLVFLSFFGIFTNQFVPVWMSDNESEHMSEAMEQIVQLKSSIDGLIADYPNSLVAPTPIFVPVKLSSAGIPVFAAPTAGVLKFVPNIAASVPSFNVSYTYLANTSTPTYLTLDPTNDGGSGGYLELYCPNRYYVEQRLVYEGGAVLVNQSEGEFVIAGIQMSVTSYVSGTSTSKVMRLTQVSLVGINKTVGGTGSKAVYADLMYADVTPYLNPSGSDVTIEIVSKHTSAWASYFGKILNASLAGLEYGTDFTITCSESGTEGYSVLTVTINGIEVLNHARAVVQLSIGELGV